jgi:hypothetical protein
MNNIEDFKKELQRMQDLIKDMDALYAKHGKDQVLECGLNELGFRLGGEFARLQWNDARCAIYTQEIGEKVLRVALQQRDAILERANFNEDSP